MSDDWWDDPVLMELDAQLDPEPEEWEADLVDSHIIAQGPGREVHRLELHDEETYAQMIVHRKNQLKRLRQLNAPQIILNNQQAMLDMATAGFCFQRSKRLRSSPLYS